MNPTSYKIVIGIGILLAFIGFIDVFLQVISISFLGMVMSFIGLAMVIASAQLMKREPWYEEGTAPIKQSK